VSVEGGGVVMELNEAGREIVRTSGDGKGERYERLLDDAPEFRDLVAAALDNREAVARKEIRGGQGNRERVVGVTVTPASGADGRFLGALALFSDLSEVRRLEARVALERHLADLGEGSAGAAEEVRNSAAAIGGVADLARRPPERAEEHLKAIRQEAAELRRVTSDFLVFARPQEFVPQPGDLASVVEEAVTDTRMAFPEASISCSGQLPEIWGSSVLLRRALSNLLRNATEATPPARRAESDAITLVGESRPGEVLLRVGDRGSGVDPLVRDKIFLPFYSTKPSGAGFGLAIVSRIAELHGGTVEVNARPGGGALFTLRLSLAAPSGAPSGPRSGQQSARSGPPDRPASP